MKKADKYLLQERLKYFVENLSPVDLFPHLECLTVHDKEKIECDSKQSGDSRATQTLVDRLIKRGDRAFPQFVQALRTTGYENLAMIIDPRYQVKHDVEESKSNVQYSCVAGPTTDTRITLRILNKDTRQINKQVEEIIIQEFKVQKSEKSRHARKEFSKYLPQGAAFLCTVSDCSEKSVQMVFRLSQVEAADAFWEMYQARDLHLHLRNVMTSCIEHDLFSGEGLDFDVNFVKDRFDDARKRLEDLESGQVYRQHCLSLEDNENEELQPINLPDFKLPEVYVDNGTGQETLKLNLRSYQRELAGPALEGLNTIICAPTNSGKTYVALQIARNHLDSRNGNGKVLFLVSTVNLVLQQRERFQLYLNDKYTITEISSAHAMTHPLEEKVRSNHIVVLTAQILVNALREKRLSLHDVSLLIFDECHHTHGDHPYNATMELYMTLALQPGLTQQLPQVIGMTASLGVGKAKNAKEAQKHILSLCANLNTDTITTVEINREELSQHTSTPNRTVHPVASNGKNDLFYCIMNQAMEKIEEFVANSSLKAALPPSGREGQGYRQWCQTLYENAAIAGNRYVVTYADQLREYNIALSVNDATRMKDARLRLKKYFDRLDESKFTDVDCKLRKLYDNANDALEDGLEKHGEPLNPKLVKIQEILLELNKAKAKGILFCKTRETTIALENWIRENDLLKMILKPLRLVGTSDSEGSMTQKDQDQVISKFRHGSECNLIIATTVAEEGLDIDDCNYVIRYDLIGNEISSVQSRGRIRTLQGGHYCSVIGVDSSGVEKERLNRYRECLMTEALAQVQNMDQNAYKEEVEKLQTEAANERALKKRLRDSLKSRYDPNDVTLMCIQCQTIACQAHDLRRAQSSYHIVMPEDFESKIDKTEIPVQSMKTFGDVTMKQPIRCKKCGQHWGCMVNLRGLEMPCLKAESFVMQLSEKNRKLIKKWNKCPFEIRDVGISELLDLKVNG